MADRFVVQYANSTHEIVLPQTLASDLGLLLAAVEDRFIVQYGNTLREIGLPHSVPVGLDEGLTAVSDRLIVQYANTLREILLPAALPTQLDAELGAVQDRLVVQAANSGREETLKYPLPLLNDTTAPVITQAIGEEIDATGTITLTWTTNEFATSFIAYGTVLGDYPQNVSKSEFTKEHLLVLSGISPNTQYFYEIGGVDRSGNAYQSLIGSFPIEAPTLYLPMLRRH